MATCYYYVNKPDTEVDINGFNSDSDVVSKLIPFELDKLPDDIGFYSKEWNEIANQISQEIYNQEKWEEFTVYVVLDKNSTYARAVTHVEIEYIPQPRFINYVLA